MFGLMVMLSAFAPPLAALLQLSASAMPVDWNVMHPSVARSDTGGCTRPDDCDLRSDGSPLSYWHGLPPASSANTNQYCHVTVPAVVQVVALAEATLQIDTGALRFMASERAKCMA